MALKTIVKVSQVSNMTDARYAAGMMVDFLGFHLAASETLQNSINEVKDIFSWVQGPELVLEFDDFPIAELETLSFEGLPVAGVQTTSIEFFNFFAQKFPDCKLFFPILFSNADAMMQAIEATSAIKEETFAVLDLTQFSTNPEHLESLRGFCSKYKVLLTGLTNEAQIETLLAEIQPFGINLVAGLETKPGFKEFDFVVSVLESLEIDD